MSGSDPYGDDARDAAQASDLARIAGYSVSARQGVRPRTSADLRDRARQLIETYDEAAALRAAELYLQEADRLCAEAAAEFSENRRMAEKLVKLHEELAEMQERLFRDRAEAERERRTLLRRHRELVQLGDSLAVKEEALKALESELMVKKPRRRVIEAAPAPAFADSGPLNLRPDPQTACTPADFLVCLGMFRIWSGNRSLRQIADQSGNRISASGVRNILSGSTLPDRLEVIDAIVQGCGGNEEDRAAFATAWRRLYMRLPSTAAVVEVLPDV